MKVVRKVAQAVDWTLAVVLALAALGLLAARIAPSEWAAFSRPLGDFAFLNGWGLALVTLGALLVLALNAAAAWDWARSVFWPEYLRLDTMSGRVSVSVRAVEQALKRAVLDLDEVSDASVSVTPPGKPGKPVEVRAYVAIKETVIYQSVSRGILDVLETRFGEIVGAGVAVSCRVFWQKITYDGSRAPRRRGAPAESMMPQFPVGDEGQ
jgi:hypothetical protein